MLGILCRVLQAFAFRVSSSSLLHVWGEVGLLSEIMCGDRASVLLFFAAVDVWFSSLLFHDLYITTIFVNMYCYYCRGNVI